MDEATVGLPRKTIEEFTTSELIDALKSNPTTEFSHVASSASVSLSVSGPADILVVKRDA